ncbi:MAG: hypothetical protein K8R76_12785 [Candidatus Aegiribacteria sp.]|nr:hypothetical protein [Candidatus Aegiribacteria sp.]
MENSSQKKILEMLSEGKITVEEATALLSKLQNTDNDIDESSSEKDQDSRGKTPKYLRVLVDSAEGDKVNVRVPLSLIKTGIKLSALIPGDAAARIGNSGLDLSQISELSGDELIEALRELQVDVDSANGDKVRVFTE